MIASGTGMAQNEPLQEASRPVLLPANQQVRFKRILFRQCRKEDLCPTLKTSRATRRMNASRKPTAAFALSVVVRRWKFVVKLNAVVATPSVRRVVKEEGNKAFW
jgi:hypothetical protein